MRNLQLTFDYSTHSQKSGEDFAKFCGLLRIYELYKIIIIPNPKLPTKLKAVKKTRLGKVLVPDAFSRVL